MKPFPRMFLFGMIDDTKSSCLLTLRLAWCLFLVVTLPTYTQGVPAQTTSDERSNVIVSPQGPKYNGLARGQSVCNERTRRLLLDGCKCLRNGTAIVCCGVKTASEIRLCSDELNNAIDGPLVEASTNAPFATSLVIEASNISSFSLDHSLFDRLEMSVDELQQLRIVNTSMSKLQLCALMGKRGRHGHRSHTRSAVVLTSGKSRHSMTVGDSAEDDDVIPCDALNSLRSLDLRDNQLSHLNEFSLPNLQELHLSGNYWDCFAGEAERQTRTSENEAKEDMSDDATSKTAYNSPMAGWMVEKYGSKIRDSSSTFCAKPKSARRPLKSKVRHVNVTLVYFLTFKEQMESQCPASCQCYIFNIKTPLWVKVDCRGSNLTRLPEFLPPNTQVLNVSNNMIKSLEPVRTNPSYAHLRQLMASDNQITTMADLIGSPFVKNSPTTINLQYNKLTVFNLDILRPILSNTDNHPHSTRYLFAKNPWSCDCESVNEIQQFVYEYKVFLRDADYLACGVEESPLFIKLDYNSLCTDDSGVDYMVILIVVEVLLLTLILSKLSYDIWQYRRTGELPWLARHICLGYSYSGIKSTHSCRDEQQHNCVEGERPEGLANGQPDNKGGNGFVAFLRCFHTKSRSLQSVSNNSSQRNGLFSLQDMVAFRPRRHTASTSHSSTRLACSTTGNGTGGSKAMSPIQKWSPLHSNNKRKEPQQLTSEEATQSLLDRCSSPRSVASSSTSTVGDRVKKISVTEEIQLRNHVLEPPPENCVSPTKSCNGAPPSAELHVKQGRNLKRNISRSTGTLEGVVAL